MKRGCKVVALAAAVVIGSFTPAFTQSARGGDDLTLSPQYKTPLYLDEPAPPPPPDKPLTALMKKEGINTGDIAIYGFVEGSYTASFNNPPNNFITGRVFDIDNEEVILNQIDLSIEKTVDAAAAAKDNKWNIGGKVEIIYGNDPRFIHSNGLNFYGSASPQLDPENQFDLTQAYVDIGIPVGTGLLVRAGKFVTLLGQETINPTTNALYSHSYLFGFAIPFTHTGVTGTYSLNDKVSVTGGIVRGWDQATDDNNDCISYLGQVKYVFNDKITNYFNFVTGPESTDNALWRTVFDDVINYAVTDKVSLGANGDFGFEPGASPTGSAAQWYGVALYSGYKFNDYATANLRGEWFADPQGARGLGGNVYEVTAGLTVHPMPGDKLGQNLVVRPEIRWDYSDQGIFNGGASDYQWTAALDAIFTF